MTLLRILNTQFIYLCSLLIFSFFFFSSRRRHTRFKCDWSSDVCSSDLTYLDGIDGPEASALRKGGTAQMLDPLTGYLERSEERRVGKECRSRWSPYH